MTKSPKTPKAPTTPKRRQPPLEKQFKPGQSGNPAGRPKGSVNKITRGRFARMLLEEAERAAPGRPAISKHRAMIQALYDMAGMGELKAAALILPLALEAEAIVADLDAAEAERAADAAAEADRVVAAEQARTDAAHDEVFAARLAAEEPDVYCRARELMSRSQKPFAHSEWLSEGVRSTLPLRFTDAVEIARVQITLGKGPRDLLDPHLAAAALATAKREAEEEAENNEEEEEEEAARPVRSRASGSGKGA